MGMSELQAKIKEAEEYLREIEIFHVSLQHKSIEIHELEQATEYLQTKKEEIDRLLDDIKILKAAYLD